MTIEGEPTAGNDAMHMGMMRQCRAPGVQHQRRANLGTQMLGIGGDGGERVGRDLEQQAIDHRLVEYPISLIGAGSVTTGRRLGHCRQTSAKN